MSPCPTSFLRAIAATLKRETSEADIAARALRHQAERMLADPADPAPDLADLVLQLDALRADLLVAETVHAEARRRFDEQSRAIESRIEQILGGAS